MFGTPGALPAYYNQHSQPNLTTNSAAAVNHYQNPMAPTLPLIVMAKPNHIPKKTHTTDERLNLLGHMLNQAERLFWQEDSSGARDRLFIAPEFFFQLPLDNNVTDPDDPSSYNEPLNEEQKNNLVGQLKMLSLTYPSLTIMPGTIHWKKSVTRSETFDSYSMRKQLEYYKPEQAFYKYRNKHNGSLQPNNALTNPNHRLYKAMRNRQQVASLLNTTEENSTFMQTTHLVKNTSYTFQNGLIKNKYNKVFADDDNAKDMGPQFRHPEQRIFSPGTSAGGEFTLERSGIRVTSEICRDHLYKLTSTQNPQGPGPLHVIQSDTVAMHYTPQLASCTHFIAHSSTYDEIAGNNNTTTTPAHGMFANNSAFEFQKTDPILSSDKVDLYDPSKFNR